MGDRRIEATHRLAQLRGYAASLPTPFRDTDEIDSAALERLCHRHVEEGACALVVCGVTAESPTLRQDERQAIVRIALAASRGRIPVIAAVDCNSTQNSIELAKHAEATGATAILSVVPYYNKPTQSGMYAHFRTIAEATGLPVLLHDVPSRTARGLADDTIARLAEVPGIIGLLDAASDLGRPLRLRARLGSEFRLLSEDEATALAFLAQGGDGCISVTSNVAPGLVREMHAAWTTEEISQAQKLAATIDVLSAILARESEPAPLKYALSLMKLASPKVRLPLVEPGSDTKAEIEKVLLRIAGKHSNSLMGFIYREAPYANWSANRTRTSSRFALIPGGAGRELQH